MPITYSDKAPGVYIEEVDRGTKPVQGVPTAIAAFVGFTEKAEAVNEDGYTTRSLLSEATLVTNWGQYYQQFGDLVEDAYLPYAVRGFFDNGGSICHIISIRTLGNPLPAQAFIPMYSEGKRGEPALVVHASVPGAKGNELTIRIEDPTVPRNNGATQTSTQRNTTSGSPQTEQDAENSSGTQPASPTQQTQTRQSGRSNGNPPQPGQFRIVVERDKSVVAEQTVTWDDLPAWQEREGEKPTVHDRFQDSVKVWKIPTNTMLANGQKMPQFGRYPLHNGASKLDLELLPKSDQDLLTDPTDKNVTDVFKKQSLALFEGSTPQRKAIGALEAVDNINLVCVPDLMLAHERGWIDDEQLRGIQQMVLDHCRKMHYRFAILDAPHNKQTAQQILDWRVKEAAYDSMHGALYYPWIKIVDPVTNRSRFVPPSGYVAGIYARSDDERGVHKAPANEVVAGAIDVKMNVTKEEQGLLNPVGINCIRKFPGRGIRVYGARTLSSDPSWRYINVRRIFNFVEESIERSTQWIVFEPNDQLLWAKVRRDVTAFLRTVWLSGALFGATPEQAFYVKCDESTNLPELVDLGQMVCEIGMSPVKPAEFVIFRFSQWAGQNSEV